MGIFSLPAEPTRCSDSLLWFAPSPWSPLRLTPCSLELATLVSATLVLDTLVPPLLPLPLLPPVLLEATPPLEATTARGRLRLSPTSATPVLATLDLDTATLGHTATASLLPVSTPPTSPSLAGGSTKQTSIATFSTSFCALKMRGTPSGFSSYPGKTKKYIFFSPKKKKKKKKKS